MWWLRDAVDSFNLAFGVGFIVSRYLRRDRFLGANKSGHDPY